jgi:hypothetical protein
VSPRDYSMKLEELHIEIAGRWSADDMAIFLHDLSVMYDIRRALDIEPDLLRYIRRYGQPPFPWGPEPWWRWLPGPPGSGLEIRRIMYSSPGYIDLKGLGEAVKQIRLLIEGLISFHETRREARLKNDSREQDVQAKMIENARDFLRLKTEAREQGFDDDGAVRQLAAAIEDSQERTLRLIERGNIKQIGPGSKNPTEHK